MLLVIVKMCCRCSFKGGVGVLGAVGMSPEVLEQELNWIDERIDGKPYGVDVLIPNKMLGKGRI